MEARPVVGKDFQSNVEQLSQKVAELLSSSVTVADDGETVVGNHLADGNWRALATGDAVSTRLAQAVVDLVMEEATSVEQLQYYAEVKDKFIFDLLRGDQRNEEQVLRLAKFLGLDLRPPRAVIVIDAAEFVLAGHDAVFDSGSHRHRAQRVIDSIVSFFHLPNEAICTHLGGGEIAVLKASDTRNLLPWAEHQGQWDAMASTWANLVALKRASKALLAHVRHDTGMAMNVGIGRYYPGVDGLAKSYNDAKIALSLGTRLGAPDRVYSLDGLGVAAFIGIPDEQTKLELAAHLLSPLENEPEIMKTLDAFFSENCSPSATAKRLFVHRNTLRCRLDKAAFLTGLDPRCFDDAVLIRVALLLHNLQ